MLFDSLTLFCLVFLLNDIGFLRGIVCKRQWEVYRGEETEGSSY